MTNLANGYHSLHRYEEALKLREETFELFKAKYGANDYDTLMAMHNLGSNLRAYWSLFGRPSRSPRKRVPRRSRRLVSTTPNHQFVWAWPKT